MNEEAAASTNFVDRPIYTIAALAVALRLVVAGVSHFTNEDAYITLRYAMRIAQGHGFTYNPGSHVLGTTTPLYALILAAFCRLGLPALVCGKLLNIVADGALCIVVARWVRVVYGETKASEAQAAAITACLLVALNPIHIRWSISGMETSLVTLCGAGVWLLYSKRRESAFALLAVLFLLRWDSLLLLAALAAGIVWRTQKVPWRGLLCYGALVLPWVVFAWFYFGSPIPVTAASKMAVYGWRADHDPVWLLRRFPQIWHAAAVFLGDPFCIAATCFATAGAAIATKCRMSLLAPPTAWFAAYWVGFLMSRVLLFPWYPVPPMIVFEALTGIGCAAALSRLQAKFAGRWDAGAIKAAKYWLCVLTFAGIGAFMTNSCTTNQRTIGLCYEQVGTWLQSNTSPDDRVMLEPIGYIGYFSNLQVLDVVGLVTPWTTSAYTPTALAPMRDIALQYRPEWCVLRPVELKHITDAEQIEPSEWSENYVEVKRFSLPRSNDDPIEFAVFHRRGPGPALADSHSAKPGRIMQRESR